MTPKQLVRRAIRQLALRGQKPIRSNGKLEYQTLQKPGGNWVYVKYHPENNCTLWQTFMYNEISQQMVNGFIPTPCMDCYKVVARPATWRGFVRLYEDMAQHLFSYPSKIGIETREDVDALYGAYWYCRGLDEGFDRLDKVRDTIRVPAFLKRGCTGYEIDHGPSDRWEVKPHQKEVEKAVFSRVHVDNYKDPQTQGDVNEIVMNWKDFADMAGPDYQPSHFYVTYERTDGKSTAATA